MRPILAIFNKEFKSYFYSPVGYIIIAGFTLLLAIFFYNSVAQFMNDALRDQIMAQQYRQAPRIFNINFQIIIPMFYNISFFSLIFLPLITMRLYSEEKRSGTVELLYTTPITPLQIILGKFLAGLGFFCVALVPTIFFQSILFLYGDPSIWPLISGYLGVILLGAAYISLGLFVSTTTENQIIAAIGGFGLSFILWLVEWSAGFAGETFGALLRYLSIIGHFSDFAQGVIDTTHIAYYLLFVVFGLYLSLKMVESAKWRA